MGRPSLARDQIATRILAGDVLLIYRQQVLRIPPSWLAAHPGGSLPILHFVGRDATDEIEAFHGPKTLDRIRPFIIADLHTTENDDNGGGWQPLVPPVMSGWVTKLGAAGRPQWQLEADALRSEDSAHADSELSPSSQILLVKKTVSSSSAEASPTGPTLSTLLPPPTALSAEIQAQHSAAYRALHQRITDAGLYQCRYLAAYGPEFVRYCLLAAASAFAYHHDWLITSAVFLGLLWHQLVFTVHDLGHMGVTHAWAFDRLVAVLIADFIGGLSIGWWVNNHNVHHLVTNHVSHDPDIQHMPFFAISPDFLRGLWSSYYKRVMTFDAFSRFVLSVQHKLFYVVLCFGRFNLYNLSYTHLVKTGHRIISAWMRGERQHRAGAYAWAFEVFGIAVFWCWFGAVLKGCGSWQKALAYVVVSHVVTSPLHLQIVLSHFSRSTADLGPTESFPHRQLRTTTDVICSSDVEFIHGGLHLQVTHHLFPRLPRHNLREASLLVKEFAKEQGLEYAEFGFIEGNREVRGVLRSVADQVKIMGKVAAAEVDEALERKNR